MSKKRANTTPASPEEPQEESSGKLRGGNRGGAEMQMERKKLGEMQPAEYNPRKELKQGDPLYEKLKKSITEFGYVEPIVWNKQTNHIVGGHQRFQVLKDEGVEEVDVVVVDLPLEREKTLNLALNKIQGEWDFPKLSVVLKDLDIQLQSVSGFDPHEITILTQDEAIDLSQFDEPLPPSEANMGAKQDSYLIYLSFSTPEGAQAWLEKNAPETTFKKGKKTCVVDMG